MCANGTRVPWCPCVGEEETGVPSATIVNGTLVGALLKHLQPSSRLQPEMWECGRLSASPC